MGRELRMERELAMGRGDGDGDGDEREIETEMKMDMVRYLRWRELGERDWKEMGRAACNARKVGTELCGAFLVGNILMLNTRGWS